MDVCCWGWKTRTAVQSKHSTSELFTQTLRRVWFSLCLVLFALISIVVVGYTYTCVHPTIVWRSEDTLHWFFLPLGVPGSNVGHPASMEGTFTC